MRTKAVKLLHGDLRAILPTMNANSLDACVCDPPYDLTSGGSKGFMGLAWDGTGVAFDVETWRAVYRVLKPGAYLVAFGGTRTSHRMTCAIEDAGFEIRDSLAWLYGSGFPKSLDVSKAIDKAAGATRRIVGRKTGRSATPVSDMRGGRMHAGGPLAGRFDASAITAPSTADARTWAGWGTALKPAHEPIVLARKPFPGTVASNVRAFGTGALNIDACRIGTANTQHVKKGGRGDFPHEDDAWTPKSFLAGSASGRWPANVLLDEPMAAALDWQTGERPSGGRAHQPGETIKGRWRENEGRTDPRLRASAYERQPDKGGASRFFYCAKPSRKERNAGCDRLPSRTKRILNGGIPSAVNSDPREMSGGGDRQARNFHPTVKPVALMRWLVRLVTPIGGTVLDCFAGSGTTGMACKAEHRPCILIERERRYLPIIRARVRASEGAA